MPMTAPFVLAIYCAKGGRETAYELEEEFVGMCSMPFLVLANFRTAARCMG